VRSIRVEQKWRREEGSAPEFPTKEVVLMTARERRAAARAATVECIECKARLGQTDKRIFVAATAGEYECEVRLTKGTCA
jgi:hypothetical protein